MRRGCHRKAEGSFCYIEGGPETKPERESSHTQTPQFNTCPRAGSQGAPEGDRLPLGLGANSPQLEGSEDGRPPRLAASDRGQKSAWQDMVGRVKSGRVPEADADLDGPFQPQEKGCHGPSQH